MARCGMISMIFGGLAAAVLLFAAWEGWTAYSKVAEKQRTSVEGNDANGGNAVWAAMQNYDASASPAYVFIGNAMPKTDLTLCPDIMAQVTVTLTDWNDTDMYNPLDDFTGMDMASGVIPLTEVCSTGIIGSTYASFPVGSTFEYPTCTTNCDMYTSGWSASYPNNYGLVIDSTYMIDGAAVGVYVINKTVKDYAEDTWARLMETAGDNVNMVMWTIPIGIVLAVVACFTMESDPASDESGQELNQS